MTSTAITLAGALSTELSGIKNEIDRKRALAAVLRMLADVDTDSECYVANAAADVEADATLLGDGRYWEEKTEHERQMAAVRAA